MDAHPLLAGAGAGGVGVVLLLLDVHAAALHVLDAVGGQQLLGQLDEQRRLLGVGHAERVDVVVGDPRRRRVHRLGRELDAVAVDRRGDLGDGDRLLGQPHGLGGGEDDAGREAPGALVHHADGEAEVLAVGERLEPGVAQADRLGADALDPEVGVLAAQVDRPGQRGVGERGQREGEEGLVDGAGRCHAPLSTRPPDALWRMRRGRALADQPTADDVTLTFGGTATMLLRLGPFTLLTDPNFLHRGQRAHLGYGLRAKRLTEPALQPTQLPALDAILLSHMHGDHWDRIADAVAAEGHARW